MPIRNHKRKIILALAAVLLIYSLGYVYCRKNKWIVHLTSNVDGKCTGHDVNSGDFKLNTLPSTAAGFYTPLRYLELGVWKIIKPDGSRC
ncbi:MAG TPA: hypothetical protein VKD91_02575 [Pyrinomonadaceae bacterium]|nr:hypothetical protein [Pyrinomonadaceae bacterium]